MMVEVAENLSSSVVSSLTAFSQIRKVIEINMLYYSIQFNVQMLLNIKLNFLFLLPV